MSTVAEKPKTQTPEPGQGAVNPETIAETKMPDDKGWRMNSTNTILTIGVSIIILGGAVVGVIIRGWDTERRSIETASKVEKFQDVATDVTTIKVKIGYMEKNVDSIAQDVKKIAEQKK